MFILSASKVHLSVCQRETVTSGSANVYFVQFEFNDDWNGLNKTAVFQAGDDKRSVVLDESNQCQIPWEVLKKPGRSLEAGVYGKKDGSIVLPTIWAHLETIKEGCSPGTNTQPPTPDVYSQILDVANKAQKIAQSVRDDADAGKFDGEPGPPGEGVPGIDPDDEGKYLGVLDGAPTWMLGGSGSGNVSSPEIAMIRVMDLSDYEALETKNPNTLYLLRG